MRASSQVREIACAEANGRAPLNDHADKRERRPQPSSCRDHFVGAGPRALEGSHAHEDRRVIPPEELRDLPVAHPELASQTQPQLPARPRNPPRPSSSAHLLACHAARLAHGIEESQEVTFTQGFEDRLGRHVVFSG